MLDFVKETIGKGLKIEDVGKEIENYIGIDKFNEVLEDIALDGDRNGKIYEDFTIIDEDENRECMEGFGCWYSLDVAIQNDKLGMLFVGVYGGDLDEDGIRKGIELLEDIMVYKMTDNFKEKLNEYKKNKEIE